MLPLPASSSSSVGPASRPSASEAEWTRYKSMLWELWKTKGLTTVEAKRHMEHYYQFYASKQAFDRRFKAWGWGKNLKAHEWHQVKLQLEKRSRDTGRESEVELKGTTVQATSKRLKRFHLSYVDGLQLEQRQTALPQGVFISDRCELAEGRTMLECLPSVSFFLNLKEFLGEILCNRDERLISLTDLGRYVSSRDMHDPEARSSGGDLSAGPDVLDIIIPAHSSLSNDLIPSFLNRAFPSFTQCSEILNRLKASDHSVRVLMFRALTTVPGVVADLASLALLSDAANEDDLSAAKELLPRLSGFLNQPMSIGLPREIRPVDKARSLSMVELFAEHGADLRLAKDPFRRLLSLNLHFTELMGLYYLFIRVDHPDTETSIPVIASVSSPAVLRLLVSKFKDYDHISTIIAWTMTNDQPEVKKGRHKALQKYGTKLNVQLLLAMASAKGDLTIVHSLIEMGINLNESVELPYDGLSHEFGSATALQYAISNGHMTIAMMLLDAGASPLSSTAPGLPTPLQLALLHQDSKLARKLLQSGALVDGLAPVFDWHIYANYSSLPIFGEIVISSIRLAVTMGDIELINDLLQAGADLDEPLLPGSNGSVVTIALEMGDLELARFLFQKGALITEPRSEDNMITLLKRESAERGFARDCWPDPEYTTFSALQYISVQDLRSMIPSDLQVSKVDLNAFFFEDIHHGGGYFNWTCYQEYLWRRGHRSPLVINQGDELPRLMTPLTHAIYWCREHDKPGRPSDQSCRKTPLDHQYIRELIRCGACTNIEGESISALAYAVQQGCQECVYILLQNGAKLCDGTAVRYAVRRQDFDLLLSIVPSLFPPGFDPLKDVYSFPKVPLPHETVRGILKGAVESSYEHGSDLLQCFIKVIDVDFSAPCMVTVLEDVGTRYTEDSLKKLLAAGVPTFDNLQGDSYPCCGYEREEYTVDGRTSLLWASISPRQEEYKHECGNDFVFEKKSSLESELKGDLKFGRTKFLLKSGFRPTQAHRYYRELRTEIRQDHRTEVKQMLQVEEITELRLAIRHGNLEVVKCLIDAGANVHRPARGCLDSTALQEAVTCERLEMVQYLLKEQGVSPNEPPAESYGGTALQIASSFEAIQILRELLQAGADVNAPAAGYENRACQIRRRNEENHMLQEQRESHEEWESDDDDESCCRDEGYVNSREESTISVPNSTALEVAARYGRLDTVALLLDHGADISDSDFGIHQYKKAKRIARKEGYPVIAKMLKDRRDKMKSDNQVDTGKI